jgi:uncharacterized LabA/DUF88 family protein
MNVPEPPIKRTVSFFDGQNLYRHAMAAFGHHHPNYDPVKLTGAICASKGWVSHGVRFYTGVPDARHDPAWHAYWSNRTLQMRRSGILVTTRPLRYRETEVTNLDGSKRVVEVPHEKGIDVRLALDVVRLARGNQYDVALIFSQDQDLAEVVEDVVEIAKSQQRWIKVACAFPSSAQATATRGIDRAEWVPMDRTFYDACLDPRDYRPRSAT